MMPNDYLSHFPRPPKDNGRGVHWSHTAYFWGQKNWAFWKEQIQAMRLKWVKVLDDGSGSAEGLIKRLIDLKVMPVVRFYREEPNPGRINEGREGETAKRYAEMGAVYFETNNEPDLALEWKKRKRPENWLDIVVDNFIIEADIIRSFGGYLLFPAFGPGGRGNPFEMIVQRGRKDILDGNCCLAIHNYCLGRPLDYPNDGINDRGQPLTEEEWEEKGGMWAWEMGYETVNEHRRNLANPNADIMQDSTCFRAFEYFDALVREACGHSIPIFTTEGGYNVGQRAGTTFGDDPRYPKPTPEWTGRLTEDMFRYMQEDAPDYYFACMPWLIAVKEMGIWHEGFENQGPWFTHHFDKQFGLNGVLPIVPKLKALPSKVRQDGPVPVGFSRFEWSIDMAGKDFDDRLKYLEPSIEIVLYTGGGDYWELVEASWRSKDEGANGRIYVRALDVGGNIIEGADFIAHHGDDFTRGVTKSEIDDGYGDVMMTAPRPTYWVEMAEWPSDKIKNLGLGIENKPSWDQADFLLTYQLRSGTVEPAPQPEPEPAPQPNPDTSGDFIRKELVVKFIDELEGIAGELREALG